MNIKTTYYTGYHLECKQFIVYYHWRVEGQQRLQTNRRQFIKTELKSISNNKKDFSYDRIETLQCSKVFDLKF